MTLQEWMKKTGATAADVAPKIGVDRQSVYRYIRRERLPRPATIQCIAIMTKGKVSAVDWYSAEAAA